MIKIIKLNSNQFAIYEKINDGWVLRAVVSNMPDALFLKRKLLGASHV